MNLEKLFSPASIAIVGASEQAGSVGKSIAKNILTLGFEGEVFLVNPKYPEMFSKKCYANISEIGQEIDLAIVAVPAKFVNDVILEAKNVVKNFVIISAGFGETGAQGKAREEALKKIVSENNLNILGPNCLGFIVPSLRLNASFAGGMPAAGNIALVSQSGALAVAMMDAGKKFDFGFSGIFSVGNKMQISESEMLEYLAEDKKTKVIGMYLEGIENGQKFLEIAGKISGQKPIVILKAGKTEKSQQAIASHTGALAGSDEIFRAVMEKNNIIQAENLENFFHLLSLLSNFEAPKNSEVAVVTNAGGIGVLTADAFEKKNIKLAEISSELKENLRAFLSLESSVENPIDLLGDADEMRYEKALEILGEDKNIGSIICLLTPQEQTPVERIAEKIVAFNKNSPKIVSAAFVGEEKVEKMMTEMRAGGIFCSDFPEQIVNALEKYFVWGKHRMDSCLPARQAGSVAGMTTINEDRKNKALKILEKAKLENRKALLYSESAEIMAMYGIKTVETYDADSKSIIFPVVVKVDSDKVLHKTDKQGLILNIGNQEELERAIATMQKNFPGENFIIQPMQKIQTELILGIKKDEVFGPIIVVGLGGIYTEVFKMVDFLVPPVSQDEIKEKLLNGKLKFMFQKTRGQEAYDLEELSGILWGLSFLAQELPEIKELDINPLLAYNDGKEATAVDVKILT